MIRRTTSRAWCALLAIGSALACSGEAAPVAPEPSELTTSCSAPVQVTVTTASPPAFTWTPHCGVDRLMVEDLSEPDGIYGITWGLVGADVRVLPDVRYGTVQAGTRPLGPGSALLADREYRVRLLRFTSSGDVLLGHAVFIP